MGTTVEIIPQRIKELMEKFSLYLVGGTVRDILLGKNPQDFDLVGKNIEEVLQELKKNKIKVIELDEEEKEYRAIFRNFWIDIGELKGNSIEEDLMQRDFTINSMAFNIEGEIIDPYNGLDDLKKGIIRALSRENLLSDPVRILRAFRFYAVLNFEIERNTLQWIKELRHTLKTVAPERIRQEILKILESKRVYQTFKLMAELEVLDVIFPETEGLRRTAQRYYNEQNLLYHSLLALKYTEELLNGEYRHIKYEPIYLLGTLFHDIGKPQTITYDEQGNTHFYGHDKLGAEIMEKRLRNLRFSEKEIEAVKKIIYFHMYPHHLAGVEELTKKAVARYLRKTEELADFLLVMARADAKASPPHPMGMKGYDRLERMIKEIREEGKDKPPRILTGYDLIAMGLKPSPLFKVILEEVNDEYRAGNIKNKQEAIRFVIKKFLNNKGGEVNGKTDS